MVFIQKKWRFPKFVWGLVILEFPLTVAALALFGIASPNLYRTKLWQEGADLGFNSDPSIILYAYANYKPIDTPVVWSKFMTQFNLIISVLSMFILLVKTTMYVMHTFIPLISFLVHGLLVGLYAYSVYMQSAPDKSDPKHPSNGPPWYVTKSCSLSSTDEIEGYCEQAKASFYVTCVMLALFGIHILWSIFSSIPTKEQKLARLSKLTASPASYYQEKFSNSPETEIPAEHQWELQQMGMQGMYTPGTTGAMKNPMSSRSVAFGQGTLPEHPTTPRTTAFQTSTAGSTGSRSAGGMGNALPLRERYGDAV
ncbi:hypothetical protein M501DRAFT_1025117 [Patellaria atrata CBS 101060]|uniref:Uncharacterized protein n=1 Tax=Patellaria atrata CBS 101060 TaxID=1346257 RepID=A0A9P4S815_9PEZI|nr:hypothetical protein M501DRAFT_1025117 [Patellaria atrata CBS 101060]